MKVSYAIIRYGVKQESIEENRALVAKVFEELEQREPQGFRYAALELDNGEFVHIVSEIDPSPLPALPAFKAFIEHHADRRSTPVTRTAARIVGNFRLLTDMKPERTKA
jgi:hypothetical protein